ncbi:MAG: hypothetical protein ABEJ86_03090 [Halococcoides sp.]
MASRSTTVALIVLHRLLVVLGIVAMPVAILARQAGVVLPIHRVLDRVDDRIEDTTDHQFAD